MVQAILGMPSRLRAHRATHGLSQRQVAKACGISFSTVSRIENYADYTVDTLIALAAYLDEAS